MFPFDSFTQEILSCAIDLDCLQVDLLAIEKARPKARFVIVHRCIIICSFTGVTAKTLRPPSCVILRPPLSLLSRLSRPPEETEDSFCSAAGILSNTDADKLARCSKRMKKKVGYTRANRRKEMVCVLVPEIY